MFAGAALAALGAELELADALEAWEAVGAEEIDAGGADDADEEGRHCE